MQDSCLNKKASCYHCVIKILVLHCFLTCKEHQTKYSVYRWESQESFTVVECRFWVADSTARRNTLFLNNKEGVLIMKQRTRIYYSEEQKSQMWDRWQKGESLHSIASLFDRYHPSISRILGLTPLCQVS